jgi:hypothetical protein
MPNDRFLMTVPPQQLHTLQGWEVTPAHLAYRMGRGPHLLRAGTGGIPHGGLMVLDPHGYDGLGPAAPFCQEVIRECQARGFSGAVLDFEGRLPPLKPLVSLLDDGFSRRGWTLYVPERCAAFAPHAKVMIPSALSGGSLSRRLKEAVERFGPERTVLALQRSAEDFSLPSPSGSGTALSQEELTALRQRLRPAVFFSHELCAHYFTYMDRESGAHFVLFDDADTLRHKIELAHRAGIFTFAASWPEVSSYAQQLGLRKKSGKM